jgi:hypothetical protein
MEEQRTSRLGIVVALVLLIAVPALYVLSIGPVQVFFANKPTPAWVDVFYRPLYWIAHRSDTINGLFQWYIEHWAKWCGL